MKPQLLLLLLFLAAAHGLVAQTTDSRQKIDSLKRALKIVKSDTARAWTTYRLGDAYFSVENDSARMYALKSYKLAEKKWKNKLSPGFKRSYKLLLAHTTQLIAKAGTQTGRHEEAIVYFSKSARYRRELHDFSGAAECLSAQATAYMRTGEIDKAKKYYRKALDLHPKNTDRNVLADIYNDFGFLYLSIGKYDKAKSYFNTSIGINIRTKNYKALTLNYNNLAIVYYHRSDYPRAIDLWYKSMGISEKIGHQEGVAQSLNNIGAVYFEQEDWKKTLEHFNRALSIYKATHDLYGIPNTYNNIAVVYDNQGKTRDALRCYRLALKGFRKIDYRKDAAMTLANVAETYYGLRELDSALIYCQEARAAAAEIELTEILCFSDIIEAKIEFRKGHLERARVLSTQGLQLANETGSVKRQEEAAKILYQICEKQQDWSEAYRNHRIYIAARDSNNNIRVERDLVRKEAAYNIRKVKREAEFHKKLNGEKLNVLRKDRMLQTRTTYAIAGGSALLLLSLFFWFKSYSRKLKVKELEVEKELRSLLDRVRLLQSNLHTNLVESSAIDADKVNEKLKHLLNTSLTQREMDVLLELCKGKDNKAIAESLFVSVNTVRTHLFSIYDKMEVKSRAQAMKKAQNLNSE